jgi:hypothetical protein
MVLGDQAYERGAWANRITEGEAGVGYVFGEGIREPLRIRAGWVPDEVIKQLEAFVTLDDHRAERTEFVRQLLQQAGIQPAQGVEDGPYLWERPAPTDPDIPSRPLLLLHAIAERQRWKAEYTAAHLATSGSPPDNYSATNDQAA